MKSKFDLDHLKKFIVDERFVISNHARVRMFQRNISTENIKGIIMKGEVIEEYTDDPCPSALLLGFLHSSPYHVVVVECDDHVRIVTVYKPEEGKWIDYRKRRLTK